MKRQDCKISEALYTVDSSCLSDYTKPEERILGKECETCYEYQRLDWSHSDNAFLAVIY